MQGEPFDPNNTGGTSVPATRAAVPAVIDRGSSQALTTREGLSLQAVADRRQKILDVMAKVMKEGQDYGKIPGTDKPCLFKPGGEVLCATFSLAPGEPWVEDLSSDDCNRYRIKVPIVAPDGRVLAVGIGSASSDEEKYRWHKPVCDEEWDDTPVTQRREKWFKGRSGNPNWKGKQIRTSPADIDNTVLKMAHKRAFIAGVLLATGASSVFNQDVDSMKRELVENVVEGEVVGRTEVGAEGEAAPPKRQVRRQSEKNAGTSASTSAPPAQTAKPSSDGVYHTPPRKVRDIRVIRKKGNMRSDKYIVLLEGDDTEFSTFSETSAKEIVGFKGTPHMVVLEVEKSTNGQFVNHTIKSFAIHDRPATPPVQQQPPAADTGGDTSEEFEA